MSNGRCTLTLQRISEHDRVKYTYRSDKNKLKASTRKNVEDKEAKIESSTIGTFTLIDQYGKKLFSSFTCENIGPSTDRANMDRRIMPGKYRLSWTGSSKNKNIYSGSDKNKWIDISKRLVNVDCISKYLAVLVYREGDKGAFARRRILIHVGNYPQDTDGCLLPGYNNSGKGFIGDSIRATKDLFAHLLRVGIENVDLIVKEISGTYLNDFKVHSGNTNINSFNYSGALDNVGNFMNVNYVANKNAPARTISTLNPNVSDEYMEQIQKGGAAFNINDYDNNYSENKSKDYMYIDFRIRSTDLYTRDLDSFFPKIKNNPKNK